MEAVENRGRRAKIVVSSNCQTAGVAAALACLLPRREIVPIPLPALSDAAAMAKLEREARSADAWVTSRNHFLQSDDDAVRPREIVVIPAIARFDAFHPDLVYVRSSKTNKLTSYHYNSAIVAWCYRSRIATDDAAALFRGAIYEALGYYERWGPSVQALRESCTGTDVEFEPLYLRARRERPFMHSTNHPTARCLFVLAESVAKRLGGSADRTASPPMIPDGLAGATWPMYPEVAERLGAYGQYTWLINGVRLVGVRDFVDFTYRAYAEEGIEPQDVVIVGEKPELGAVLAQAVEGVQ